MKEQLAAFINERMEAQGLNKMGLARKAEMNRATLIHICQGKHAPTLENVYKILHALNCTMTDFELWLEYKTFKSEEK